MTIAITVGILTAGAVYLLMQREMVRIVLGFVLLSHAVNLLLVSTGGPARRDPPFQGDVDLATAADPLPQAFTLTAIVISFAITIYLLTLAVVRHREAPPDDETAQPGTDEARSGTP